jgi:hypothetical protein
MMTGSALQEDIAATTRALLSKGQDILGRRLWSHNDAFSFFQVFFTPQVASGCICLLFS